MPKAVFDTTILVSALLNFVTGGASHDLLLSAAEGKFELYLSDDILEETARVLLTGERIRKHYSYTDDDVVEYCRRLTALASIVSAVPEVRIVRDPNDDMIVACAIAAGADYVVTRDKDMLSLDHYEGIRFVAPEGFLKILREQKEGTSAPGDN